MNDPVKTRTKIQPLTQAGRGQHADIMHDLLEWLIELQRNQDALQAANRQLTADHKQTAHDLDVLTDGLKLWSAPTTKS
jgi:hypothetical protein